MSDFYHSDGLIDGSPQFVSIDDISKDRIESISYGQYVDSLAEPPEGTLLTKVQDLGRIARIRATSRPTLTEQVIAERIQVMRQLDYYHMLGEGSQS